MKAVQLPSYPSRLVLWLLFIGVAIKVVALITLELWLVYCDGQAGSGAEPSWACGPNARAAEGFSQLFRLPIMAAAIVLVLALAWSLHRMFRATRAFEELKRRAEAADRTKTEFLATVTHELRTPLNGILGLGEVLRTTNLNKRQLELLAVMTRSGRGLLEMINDLLDVARIEAGKLELHPAPTNLGNILQEVDDVLRPVTTNRGLTLEINQPDPPLPHVNVDSRALRQVLVNLVGNAIKFTEKGEVALTCAATRQGRKLAVKFVVRDTGHGIAPENLSRVFERFFQEVRPEGNHLKGTGLGLSICDEIIRKMGGKIELVSTLGTGSSFTVSLVLEIAEGNAQPAFGL